MPWGNKGSGRNNQPPSGIDHVDTNDCEYCGNGMTCPYWYQDSDGSRWLDRSGVGPNDTCGQRYL